VFFCLILLNPREIIDEVEFMKEISNFEQMKNRISVGLLLFSRLLLMLIVFLTLAHIPVCAEEKKNILILNSYHQEYKWTAEVTQGITDALKPVKDEAKFYVEYMGTKWAYHKEYLDLLPVTYKAKYSQIPLDLIVATDDDAFNFLLKHRDSVFGKVPVVFAGVNWFNSDRLAGQSLYTGVNEAADILANIDLMLMLHPSVRHLYTVVDNTTTGLIVQQKVRELIPIYSNRVTIHILSDMPIMEIYQTAAGLSDDGLVFLTIFQKDRDGVLLEYSEITERLSQYSAVPVYGLWDFNLGYGIVGGMLTSGYQQGFTAGGLALRVLKGESPDAVPVIMESPNKYRFEYNQLKRFGIKLEALPPGSDIINKPTSFYEENKAIVHLTIAFFTMLLGVIGLLLFNIRRRHLVQQDLARSEARLAEIIEFLPTATFVIDREGCVTTWNREIENMTGVPAGEILGSGNHEYSLPFYRERRPILIDLALMPQEEREELLQTQYMGVVCNGDLLTGETDTAFIKGEQRYLEGRAHPFYNEVGEIIGAIETISDITDKKRSEEFRLARDVADSANRSKSLFLANMSHELRTPLNAILGFAQIMARDSGISDIHREKLDIILKSGDHLLNLINNILDLAKIESGKTVLEPEDFDLGGLIEEVIQMLQIKAEAKGINLFLDQSSSFPRYVNTDQVKLRQVIINVAGNAIKFTQQGHVSIRLSLLTEEAQDYGLHLFIEIEDTGSGIPAEDLDRIFSPFEQSVSRSETEGTGLGLAIAREYINMLGGSITVSSEVGKGTTFRFSILCEPVGAERIADITQEKTVIIGMEDAGQYKILIVEDHLENRIFLRKLLEPFGFQISEAIDGVTAIAAVKEWHPHLILMDRRMPGMDGIHATQEIRRLSLSLRPKIVAVTAHAYSEEQREMLDAGCDAFLRKPVRVQELFQMIRVQLGLTCQFACEASEEALQKQVAEERISEVLAELPLVLIDAMRHAVLGADIDEILMCIDRIADYDQYVSDSMRGMARRYDYESLQKVLN
jgi:PAS domain S-box-containing protein